MSLEPTPVEQARQAEMEGDVDAAARILFRALVTTPVLQSAPDSAALEPDTSLHHLLTSALPPRMVPLFFAVWAPRWENLDAAHKPGASNRTQHSSDTVSRGYSDAVSDRVKGGASARPEQSSFSKPSTLAPHNSRGTVLSPSPQALLLRQRAALLSNLGCLHLRLGKPLLAGLLFREAIASLGSLCTPGTPVWSQGARGKQGKGEGVPPPPGATSAGAMSTSAAQGEDVGAVLEAVGRAAYNLGLQEMECGEYRAAIQSLLAAVAGSEMRVSHAMGPGAGASQGVSGNSHSPVRPFGTGGGGMKSDPRVWLRLAECYCSEHRRLLRAVTKAQQRRQGLSPVSVSSRPHTAGPLTGAALSGMRQQPEQEGLAFNLVALKSSAGGAGQPKGSETGPGDASHSAGGTATGLTPGDLRGNQPPSGTEGSGLRELDSQGAVAGDEERRALLRGARCCLLNAMLLLEERLRDGGKGERGREEGQEGAEKGRELEEVLWVLQCQVELYSDNLLRCIAAGTKALALGARNLNLAANSTDKNTGPKDPSTSTRAHASHGLGVGGSGETAYSDRCLSRRVVVSLYMAEALSLLRRPLEAQEVLRGVVGPRLPPNVLGINMAALQNMIVTFQQ